MDDFLYNYSESGTARKKLNWLGRVVELSPGPGLFCSGSSRSVNLNLGLISGMLFELAATAAWRSVGAAAEKSSLLISPSSTSFLSLLFVSSLYYTFYNSF